MCVCVWQASATIDRTQAVGDLPLGAAWTRMGRGLGGSKTHMFDLGSIVFAIVVTVFCDSRFSLISSGLGTGYFQKMWKRNFSSNIQVTWCSPS